MDVAGRTYDAEKIQREIERMVKQENSRRSAFDAELKALDEQLKAAKVGPTLSSLQIYRLMLAYMEQIFVQAHVHTFDMHYLCVVRTMTKHLYWCAAYILYASLLGLNVPRT